MIERSLRQRENLFELDHVLCDSELNRADLERLGVPTDRLSVLHMPPDVVGGSRSDWWRRRDHRSGTVRLLFVGRFVRAKGVLDLLQALVESRSRLSGVEVVLAGNPLLSDPVVVEAATRAASGPLAGILRIEARPGQRRLADLYAASDALVLPSYHEGFGVPVIEALDAECFVLSYDAGNLPDVVGDCGQVLSTGDVAGLREALVALVGHIRESRRGGTLPAPGAPTVEEWRRRARTHVARHSRPEYERRFLASLAHVLEGSPGGAPRLAARRRRGPGCARARPGARMSPSVSIVISTNGRGGAVASSLGATAQLDHDQLEVIVVVGPDDAGTHEALAPWSQRITTLECPARNLSMSRNIGIAAASGELVAFIDDDALPDPGWLEPITAAFDDPEVAAAGGPVLDHTGGRLQARFSYGTRTGLAHGVVDGPAIGHILSAPDSWAFPITLGTNSCFRRERLVGIGGFDEVFDYFHDEADVCLRLVDAGWDVRPLDRGLVFHKFAPSEIRGDERVVRSWYKIMKNLAYFAYRHGLAASSLAKVTTDLASYIESSRTTLEHAIAAGVLGPEFRARFEDEVADGIDEGRTLAEGPQRTRPREWFAELQRPFRAVPDDAPRARPAASVPRQPGVPPGHAERRGAGRPRAGDVARGPRTRRSRADARNGAPARGPGGRGLGAPRPAQGGSAAEPC